MSADPITLYYWHIKARNYGAMAVAQVAGIPVKLELAPMDRPEFKALLPFGQVPYLAHGDVKIGQSNAILRYLARVGGLSGDNEAEFALSEMLIEEANDIFNLISHAHYAPHRNDAYDALFAADGKFAAQCRYLENMIPEGSTAFSSRAEGDLRLVGAIALAAVLDLANFVEPSCLLATPRLKAFHDILIESAAFEGIRDMHPYFKRDIGHQH